MGVFRACMALAPLKTRTRSCTYCIYLPDLDFLFFRINITTNTTIIRTTAPATALPTIAPKVRPGGSVVVGTVGIVVVLVVDVVVVVVVVVVIFTNPQ